MKKYTEKHAARDLTAILEAMRNPNPVTDLHPKVDTHLRDLAERICARKLVDLPAERVYAMATRTLGLMPSDHSWPFMAMLEMIAQGVEPTRVYMDEDGWIRIAP